MHPLEHFLYYSWVSSFLFGLRLSCSLSSIYLTFVLLLETHIHDVGAHGYPHCRACTVTRSCFCTASITPILPPSADTMGMESHLCNGNFHWLHHAKFECNYGVPFLICSTLCSVPTLITTSSKEMETRCRKSWPSLLQRDVERLRQEGVALRYRQRVHSIMMPVQSLSVQ